MINRKSIPFYADEDKAIADTGLFVSVAEHREQFFNQRWIDYGALSPATIQLIPDGDQLATWARDYSEMTKECFSATCPNSTKSAAWSANTRRI